MKARSQRRVLKLRFNNGTLASQQYTEGDEDARQFALVYLGSLKSKWIDNGGLEGVRIEDTPL